MHSEKEIRAVIRPLLEKYGGELTTSEIKERIGEVLILDKDDMKMSETRNEILIMQRIGNIVSHQTEPVKTYEESFTVKKSDKSDEMAKFYLSDRKN